MANRSSTTRRLTTKSAQSSAVSIYPNTTGNGYVIYGSAVTANTVFNVANIQYQQPGVSFITSSLNPPVVVPVINQVCYTDSYFNFQNANLVTCASANVSSGIRIFGSNFLPNANVWLAGNVYSTFFQTSNEIRLILNGGTYGTGNSLMVFNSNVSGAVYQPGIVWRTPPTWVTGTSLPAAFTTVSSPYSTTIVANSWSPDSITYSLVSGNSLPPGLSLNSSTGVISGTVTTSGNYSFAITATTQNNLSVTQTFNLLVDQYTIQYLIVAGGGAGGNPGGLGGGGAGGVLSGSFILPVSTPLSIGVGGGGVSATMGGNSYILSPSPLFGNLVSVGGGTANQPGGSGGGSGIFPTTQQGSGYGYPSPYPLFYTTVGQQGFPGGTGSTAGPGWTGGGGGGASQPGGASTGSTGGSGGAGYTWPFDGNTYAGGGGGGGSGGNGPLGQTNPGPGGLGGGGAGTTLTGRSGNPGAINTGGGGGGSPDTPNVPGTLGGSGGSGVVQIAYNWPGNVLLSGGIVNQTGNLYIHSFVTSGSLSFPPPH